MMKTKKKDILPRFVMNPNIKQIYVTEAFGRFTIHDFRLIIFNEKPEMGNKSDLIELIHQADHEIIMPFTTVKELNNCLNELIKEFEEEVGKIEYE